MKRIGLLILLLSVFGMILMAGCKIGKQSTPGTSRTAPAAPKK